MAFAILINYFKTCQLEKISAGGVLNEKLLQNFYSKLPSFYHFFFCPGIYVLKQFLRVPSNIPIIKIIF